eukprot:TRINITY_DN10281_c0_g1_i2.p1 TRINITY_DN10281_c0_g1~~TRINITY_DN10281_c0_g1_i2.p1  ORF type:complete len:234 (+),score=33.49 TRINITY_DN10281_c0_g1_i2:71-772(+)
MKVVQARKNKKHMAIYTNNFGFHEPYQIIVDGMFAQACLDAQVKMAERLPTLVGGRVEIYTSKCLSSELDAIGEDMLGAKLVLQQFKYRKCKHKPVKTATRCILDLVGQENINHYIIATQDPALMKKLASVPAVPVITVSGHRPVLLKPTKATDRAAQTTQQSKLGTVQTHEKAVLAKRKAAKRPAQIADSADAMASKRAPARAGLPVGRRKKKAKGPNPLSQKKKKKKQTPS